MTTVTRFEVIDHRPGGAGRVFVANPATVKLSFQDGGKTLKIFVTEAQCDECNHLLDMHKRHASGAYRCTSFGCGCERHDCGKVDNA
jgi:hypothetical protein